MIQDKKVIIAIPIYRDLREEEIVALDNIISKFYVIILLY